MSESTTAFLNRWLDRTPLGQLGRTKNFLVVPAFHINTTWLGYSDLVGVYDYQAPNNFTLRNLAGLPTGTNYTLMIAYVNSDRTVKRFKLVKGVGEVIYGDIPMYIGQVIKKNFRIEVWSTPTPTVDQATDVTLNASVLNSTDYRYGSDTTLVTAGGLVTSPFANVSTGQPDLTNASLRYLASGITQDGGGNVTSWGPAVGNITLLPFNGPTRRTFGYVDGIQNLGTAYMDGSGSNAGVFVLYLQLFCNVGPTSNNKILTLKNGVNTVLTVSRSNTTSGFTLQVATANVTRLMYSQDGIVIFEINNALGVVNLYEWVTGVLIGTVSIDVGAFIVNDITIGDAAGTVGSGAVVNQILAYSQQQSPAARNTTLEYLIGTPFIWPYSPTLNTDSLSL